MIDFRKELTDFIPRHDFFIGIDSDGCVFDSMEIKQKEFFIPVAIKHFGLHVIADELRATWEFVNLYSVNRGGNRFYSIIKVFDILRENPNVIKSGCKLPDMTTLRIWVNSETKLGNETLSKYCALNPDPDLEKVLEWSETVNKEISSGLQKIPPFPHSIEAIMASSKKADLVIVSQTPMEALVREWSESDLKKFIGVIAGQEHGTKSEHIALAAKGKYPDSRILMIGDAKGDLDAARNNGILSYPVSPGKEDKSWERFIAEGLEKFLKEIFAGDYEDTLVNDFLKSLPDKQL
jgi:phosphoglycolate phosphatase-like HAD superfamily hydrolase